MKALKDIRVLDLSRFQAGPVCGMLLGDMGADVIRVEEIGGAPDRTWGLLGSDGETLMCKIAGRSRRAVTLDLNADDGRKIFRQLVKRSDVVLHNYTPGTPFDDQLKYDYLKRINPKVIVAAVSGYGQTGPDKELVCFDHVVQARSGGLLLTGFPDCPPLKTTMTYNDIGSALFTTIGIMTALYHRERTGRGQYIDVALFDTATFCTQMMGALLLYEVYGEIRIKVGNNGFHAYVGIFETKDKEWIALCGATNAIWKRLTRAIGREDMAKDPKFGKNDMVRFANAKEIDAVIGKWMSKRTAQEAQELLQSARVPCSIVNTVDKLIDDPQVKAREMIQHITYPEVGELSLPGFPFKMSLTPGRINSRAPRVGEHNEEIYCGLLGFSKRKLSLLESKGVI
jgi:formyl-CoA transferase